MRRRQRNGSVGLAPGLAVATLVGTVNVTLVPSTSSRRPDIAGPTTSIERTVTILSVDLSSRIDNTPRHHAPAGRRPSTRRPRHRDATSSITDFVPDPTPSATPSATPTATPSATPRSPSATPSATPSTTPSATPSATPTQHRQRRRRQRPRQHQQQRPPQRLQLRHHPHQLRRRPQRPRHRRRRLRPRARRRWWPGLWRHGSAADADLDACRRAERTRAAAALDRWRRPRGWGLRTSPRWWHCSQASSPRWAPHSSCAGGNARQIAKREQRRRGAP